MNDKHKTTCHMNSLAHAAEGKQFAFVCKGCSCPPTTQHEEECKKCDCICHEKMVLCPRRDNFCNIRDCKPCTCSRQGSLDKCYLIWGEDGALTCNYNHKEGDECLVSVRQDEEAREAYEKHPAPCKCNRVCAPTPSDCICVCDRVAQEKQDWEARYDEVFPISIDYPAKPTITESGVFWEIEVENRTNRAKGKHEAIKDFIRKEKELSKEEGRMAQAQASYQAGVNYAMEFHVNGECEKRIKEARLEVIAEGEDKMLREIVPSKYEHLPEHARAGAVLQDCLAIVRSLKTNSK